MGVRSASGVRLFSRSAMSWFLPLRVEALHVDDLRQHLRVVDVRRRRRVAVAELGRGRLVVGIRSKAPPCRRTRPDLGCRPASMAPRASTCRRSTVDDPLLEAHA